MKHQLLLLSFVFPCYIVPAQSLNTTFIGSLVVKGGDSYSYKLELTDSNGVLSGYSITDLMGPNETKTAVKGTVNSNKKQIDFHETRVLYTKAKSGENEFCYIHGHLRVGKLQGAQSLKGSFTGYKEDGKTECGSGKLTMVCTKDILEKMMMHQISKSKSQNPNPQSEIPGSKSQVPDPQLAAPPTIVYEKEIPESEIKKVQPGGSVEFGCPSSTVTIELWDFRTIDGDRVTLKQDDVVILNDHTLTATHKVIAIKLERHVASVLELIALNEGTEPLNTARMKITSGDREYYLDATTTVNKSVKIVLGKIGK